MVSYLWDGHGFPLARFYIGAQWTSYIYEIISKGFLGIQSASFFIKLLNCCCSNAVKLLDEIGIRFAEVNS